MTYKEAVEGVLFSEDRHDLIKQGIDHMHKVYAKHTGISAGNLSDEKMIQTDRGLVVTPVHAAHCLIDQARTTYFLRGIYEAISTYLETKGQLRILYAGCGPYATLLTPFTALFSSEEIIFTFFDINDTSLTAVQGMYENWAIDHYIEQSILGDATSADLDLDGRYDIIISETMQAGLKNECQVPLTRNMINYLKPSGTFIPQRITVDAYLIGPENKLKLKETEKVHVGQVYDLDFLNVPSVNHSTSFELPNTKFDLLKLYTEIHVFGDHKIRAFDSGLTLPLTIARFNKKIPESITFQYQETNRPDFDFSYDF